MSAGRDITSPAELPARMRAKITEELCPVAGLDGFCWTWTGCVQSKGYGCWNYDGRRHLTHRVSYRSAVSIPSPCGGAGVMGFVFTSSLPSQSLQRRARSRQVDVSAPRPVGTTTPGGAS